jgi:hypothetical protein
VVLAGVEAQFGGRAGLGQLRRQPLAVVGAHDGIGGAVHQQDRRGVGAGKIDRLGLARPGPGPKRVAAAHFGERIEIGRRGEQGGGADDCGIDPGIAQIMPI